MGEKCIRQKVYLLQTLNYHRGTLSFYGVRFYMLIPSKSYHNIKYHYNVFSSWVMRARGQGRININSI